MVVMELMEALEEVALELVSVEVAAEEALAVQVELEVLAVMELVLD